MHRQAADNLRKASLPSPQRDAAMARLAGGVWLMASSFGDDRAGVVVRWAQCAGSEPALVSVAMRKGHPIEPLIRDSRAFALSLLVPEQATIERRFRNGLADHFADPFDTIDTERLVTGSPCLRRSPAALDCELFRHFDLEVETCMYVGLVLGARSV